MPDALGSRPRVVVEVISPSTTGRSDLPASVSSYTVFDDGGGSSR